MEKLHVKGRRKVKLKRLNLVEWRADTAFTVEVRVRGQPDNWPAQEKIRENHRDIGINIQRPNADKRSGLCRIIRLSCLQWTPSMDKEKCVCSLSMMRKISAERPR